MKSFHSEFAVLGDVAFPKFSGTRVMMMPLIIGDQSVVPDSLDHYRATLQQLFGMADGEHQGKVGYVTIDEKVLLPGESTRRQGVHVDGVFRGGPGSWGGGWGGGRNGMIVAASHAGSRAWDQMVVGEPGPNGECGHLEDQLRADAEFVLMPDKAYWLSPLCIHESMPVTEEMPRQFIRLSMPSTAPWFEGYTENPLGILPTGPILERREFM